MASTYLSKTLGTATNRKKWTFSAWVKKARHQASIDEAIFSSYAEATTSYYSRLADNGTSRFEFTEYNGSGYAINLRPTQRQRDPNAWYHIVIAYDSTQATASDRVNFYINGELVTNWANEVYPSLNLESGINKNQLHTIGKTTENSSYYYDGVMSHIHFCDGTQYQATDFGSTDATTGEWKILTSPNVTYGNNGFFILKDGNGVTDQSGNSNDWAVSGGTLSKTEDNPSNIFCTINPLQFPQADQIPTFENANTRAYGNGDDWQRIYGTLGANKGKWWYELYIGTADTSGRVGWDSIDFINDGTDSYYSGLTIQQGNGAVRGGIRGTAAYSPDAVQLPADGGGNATFSQGDYLGMGIDLDNNTITIHKNGTALATNWSYNSYNSSCKANTYGTFVSPSTNWYSASGNQNIYDFNFGNGKFGSSAALTGTTYTDSQGIGVFKYQPPTNYLAWCTKNLNV